MTEKITVSNNSSLFILMIPLAFISVVLIKTWKIIISIVFLGVGWQIWQQYEWQQFKEQVDPYFKNLIQNQRGMVTVLDLVQSAQIPNNLASKYLLNKARMYGAELMSYGDDRDTYYFLTAGVIQSILADSEPEVVREFIPPSSEEIAGMIENKLARSSVDSDISVTSAIDTSPKEQLERGSIDYFPDAAN